MRLTILLLALSLYGCRKCAQCTTTYTQKVTGQPTVTSTTTEELCGDDMEEADGRTTTSTAQVNGHTATVTAVTWCQ